MDFSYIFTVFMILFNYNRRQRKLTGQSRMKNPETLAKLGDKTLDEDKQSAQKNHNTENVTYHYMNSLIRTIES